MIGFPRSELVLLADADICADLVESALRDEDPTQVLGAVHLILVSRHERAADIVIETLLRAHEPEQLNALCEALIRSPIDGLPLGLVLDAASPEVASVVMLALAAHGRIDSLRRRPSEIAAQCRVTRRAGTGMADCQLDRSLRCVFCFRSSLGQTLETNSCFEPTWRWWSAARNSPIIRCPTTSTCRPGTSA